MPIVVVKAGSRSVETLEDHSPAVQLRTNAEPPSGVPAAVHSAADSLRRFGQVAAEHFSVPTDAEGAILWLRGEALLQGSPEAIRRNLRRPGRRTFVPVHFPCLPEIDLLSLQPRCFAAGTTDEEVVDSHIRITSGPIPCEGMVTALEQIRAPWARASLALYRDQLQLGAGLASLEQLRLEHRLHPMLDALTLRNLCALQVRQGKSQQASKLLQHGKRKYPQYAELFYLEALLAVQNGDAARAVASLERATRNPGGAFVGTGGESSYRAHWLMGVISDAVGNQSVAYHHYRTGLRANPAFEPSVIGLLKQRLPSDVIDVLEWDLCRLVRHEPRYLEPVFYFLLLHRAPAAARRLAETLDLPEPQREVLHGKIEEVCSSYRQRPAASFGPPGVVLTGPLFVNSSFARINRELGAALLSCPDADVALEPHGMATLPPLSLAKGETLLAGLYRRPRHLDLTIRHQWPPDFQRAPSGKLAVIVPWEFGAVPLKWITQVRDNVDELWVPSQFVRNVFLRGGADFQRIVVVPNGVDTRLFCPEGPAWRPPQARGFAFLFVGGLIPRKGADLLAEAFNRAFTGRDDVTLVVKDVGSDSFYKHMTVLPQIREAARKRGAPHLLVITEEIDDRSLAALYRGCDAFVLPYRGEGFCLPLLEALACGKPVIATAEGPAAEFCSPDYAYLVPAQAVPMPEPPHTFGELAGEATWFEPDVEELARMMRNVYEHRQEAALRGARGAEQILQTHSWARIVQLYLHRIGILAGMKQPAPACAIPAPA